MYETVEESFTLTSAVLGPSKVSSEGERSIVFVQVGVQKMVICSLRDGKV